MFMQRYLLTLGFESRYKGYIYLARAVELMLWESYPAGAVYAMVAKEMGVSVSCVEKTICTVINAWWKRGGRIPGFEERLTSAKLITLLAAKFRLQ